MVGKRKGDDMTKDEEKEIDFKKYLQQMRENLQAIVEAQAGQAIMLKARYDALVKVGFTKVEALELVKARGIAL